MLIKRKAADIKTHTPLSTPIKTYKDYIHIHRIHSDNQYYH